MTKELKNEVLLCMLFVDDIVPVDATKKSQSRKLNAWRERLHGKDSKTSRMKEEYQICYFGPEMQEMTSSMIIEGIQVLKMWIILLPRISNTKA